MNQKELEAAESRYRVWIEDEFYMSTDRANNIAHDLSEAYLELMDAKRTDDSKRAIEVTREWLESLGFSNQGGRFIRGQLQVTCCGGWNFWWAVSGFPHASSRLVNGLNTRGQVLDLLKALGIEVTK